MLVPRIHHSVAEAVPPVVKISSQADQQYTHNDLDPDPVESVSFWLPGSG